MSRLLRFLSVSAVALLLLGGSAYAEDSAAYSVCLKTSNDAHVLRTSEQKAVLEITNMVGVVVFRAEISEDERELRLDLKPGIYIVRIGKETSRIKVN